MTGAIFRPHPNSNHIFLLTLTVILTLTITLTLLILTLTLTSRRVQKTAMVIHLSTQLHCSSHQVQVTVSASLEDSKFC